MPYVLNSLKTAISASDALVLQYYEEENPVKAAFGHDLTIEDWKEISKPKDNG
jgi:glucose-1-phosphatase